MDKMSIKTMDRLVEHILPSLGVNASDPIVLYKAKVEARKAMKKYDPTKSNVKTYLYHRLLPLKREQLKRNQILRFPERDAQLLGGINVYKNKFLEAKGREPTDEEIRDHFSLSKKKYNQLLSTQKIGTHSLTESLPTQKGKTREEVFTDYFYHDMTDIEKFIFKHKTGYAGAPIMSNQDIAKSLKLSSGAITQRAKGLSDRLQNYLSKVSGPMYSMGEAMPTNAYVPPKAAEIPTQQLPEALENPNA